MQMISKNYVVIKFGSYVRIMFQKSSWNYMRKLRYINVRKLRDKSTQMESKI